MFRSNSGLSCQDRPQGTQPVLAQVSEADGCALAQTENLLKHVKDVCTPFCMGGTHMYQAHTRSLPVIALIQGKGEDHMCPTHT